MAFLMGGTLIKAFWANCSLPLKQDYRTELLQRSQGILFAVANVQAYSDRRC